ncbi:spore coat protein CotJB [Paenibacillus sedimenti]|uniref:Spore coat protein CotJB n=1 Tax=Paenibacillus sedimenti TaxID=2770274 RepID=A0A926KRP8_9BACL|nr:spore coat protein CotJB [Paenibacillus sedimenti]MBD0382740.1 spore coat protein CotJB [Paenibacillus sedimenti]
MSHASMPDSYYKQLHDLQAVDFVLIELTLYLDTHPDDLAALQQYNQFAQKRMQIAHQFEMEFGPLMAYGHSFTKHPWQWIEPPWPWQV